MSEELTHIDDKGRARMVDISGKTPQLRVARASGRIELTEGTVKLVAANNIKKGDVLSVAEIAGVQAAKRTSELIPLCHPLPLTQVTLDFTPQADPVGLRVEATAKVEGRTGVEMEALTAVTVACLTLYDMCKAVDRSMTFSGIRLIEKTGGRSDAFRAP